MSSKSTTMYIKLAIAVIVGLLIYFFVPAANGLTELGVRLLAVCVPTIIVWLTIGSTAWSALLSVTMAVMVGAIDANSAYTIQWGSAMITMTIPLFMLANVLEDTGAIEYIVKWLISRKIVHGRPVMFMVMVSIATIVANVFMSSGIVVVLFFKLLRQITKEIGEEINGSFYNAFGMLIAWITEICEGTLIWLRPWLITMIAVVAAYGFEGFTLTLYLRVSFLYLLIASVLLMLIVLLWVRPDLSKFRNFDDEAMRESLKEAPLPTQAKIAMAGMLIVMATYLIPNIPIFGALGAYLGSLGVTTAVTLVVCLLAIIMIDGKPVIKFGESMARLPWESIVFLGGIMFYGSVFGREEYGIGAALQSVLEPIVSKMPVFIAIAVCITACSIFTNLASNTVAVIVFSASFLPTLLGMGVEPSRVLTLGACIIMTSVTAICTKNACGLMAFVYSDGMLKYEGTQKYSVALCALMILVCLFIIMPVGTVLLAPGV